MALLATLVAVAEWIYGQSLCGWNFCYPLDDAYIHMAIARQLAESGTWGIEPGAYAFASSSPLWTVLLALMFKLFGAREWIPLVLSFVFAFGSILLAFELWQLAGLSKRAAFWCGIALVFAVPFATLSNLGMEHALHFFCIEAFVLAVWKSLSEDGKPNGKTLTMLLLSAALAAGARYESLFVVIPVVLLFAYRRMFMFAVALLLVAFLPIVTMGVYAVCHGGTFLPVSIILKAGLDDGNVLSKGLAALYSSISSDSIHFHLTILALLVVAAVPAVEKRVRELALALAIAAVGHGMFARLGWLYRYEAYIVGAAFTLLPLVLARHAKEDHCPRRLDVVARLSVWLVCIAVAFPFLSRSFQAQYDTIEAQREIYGQQMQVACIFASLPESEKGPIAVVDLGCVAYYSGVSLLDMWGLGSPEVCDLVRRRAYDAESCVKLFQKHDIRYFAVYRWCYEKCGSYMHPVANLVNTRPGVVCSDNVTILAVANESDAEPLRRHLMDFAHKLPSGMQLVFP